jgi:hypothetical protein
MNLEQKHAATERSFCGCLGKTRHFGWPPKNRMQNQDTPPKRRILEGSFAKAKADNIFLSSGNLDLCKKGR